MTFMAKKILSCKTKEKVQCTKDFSVGTISIKVYSAVVLLFTLLNNTIVKTCFSVLFFRKKRGCHSNIDNETDDEFPFPDDETA